ncbi:MAG TPA: hypothetical protein VJP86_07280 [Vicinamibacterales bacterium]|jgi:hypothetical protein|nr:hypothetical protein [Vicinamibacterales bacterium]
MPAEPAWIWWTISGAVIALVLLGAWIWWKGRSFSQGDIYHASRLSSGNRLFPTQVLITPTAVVQYTPHWIGRLEESIHMAHISSVRINTGVLLSDVLIETTGGASPIRCHGHWKGDATAMKRLIEQHQTAYYTTASRPAPPSVDPGPSRR